MPSQICTPKIQRMNKRNRYKRLNRYIYHQKIRLLASKVSNMNKTMSLLLLLLYVSSFSQESTTFSSYETLEDVKTIEINNNLCVIFYPTYFYGVSIKGDKSIKDIIKTEFKNSVLKLYTTAENSLTSYAEITIYIKDLKELRLLGTSWVQTDKKIITDSFKIHSTENGNFNLPIECKNFSLFSNLESKGSIFIESEMIQIHMKGSSEISMKLNATNVSVEQKDNSYVGLNGKAQLLTANIDNKAQLSAWNLKTKDVFLNSSSSKDIRIHAENRLKIKDKGTAMIYVKGNPKQIDTLHISKKSKIIFE